MGWEGARQGGQGRRISGCVRIHRYPGEVCAQLFVCVSVCVHVRVNDKTFLKIPVCVCMIVCVCVCVCVCVLLYLYSIGSSSAARLSWLGLSDWNISMERNLL